MAFWLMKSEPSCYSIDDLKKDKTTPWNGVRNYQARNLMRDEMKVGDRVFFYHSNAGKDTGIAGEAEVSKKAHPDHSQFDKKDEHYDPDAKQDDPRWWCVDVKFVQKYGRVITLPELKAMKSLAKMKVLQKGNRLSVTPVTAGEYKAISKKV